MTRVGIAQTKPKLGNIEYNLEHTRGILESAKEEEIEVLVLPELSNSGYSFLYEYEARNSSEKIPDGEFSQLLLDWSKSNRLVVAGICEQWDKGLGNSAGIFANGKHLGTYRKLHLFHREKELFQPGNEEPPVFEFNGHRYGIMVCWDWAFPEVSRILALKGAQVILHPANLVLPYCFNAMRTRALENGVFTVTANRLGIERKLEFSGKSQITDNKGDLLLSMSDRESGIAYADINPANADKKQMTPNNHLLKDRRPRLYGRITDLS